MFFSKETFFDGQRSSTFSEQRCNDATVVLSRFVREKVLNNL